MLHETVTSGNANFFLSNNIFGQAESEYKLHFPLYQDKVAAGFPSPASDYVEKRLNPDDYLIRNKDSTFFAEVTGDSMIDAGIFTGDVIVVDRSIDAKLGHIVLAVIDGEFTVKYLGKDETGALLIPANKDFKTIQVKDNASFSVWGVVTGSMRRFT